MTALVLPERRLVQPRGRLEVDLDVLRRLNVVALVEPTARRNLADLRPDLGGSGLGLEGTATTRLGAAFAIAQSGPSAAVSWQLYTEFTMGWYGVSGTLTSEYQPFLYGIHTVSGSPQYQGWIHSNSGTGNLIFNIYYTPGFTGSVTATHQPASGANQVVHMIGTYRRADAIRIYVGGRQVTSAAVDAIHTGATIEGAFQTGSPLRSYALSYSFMANRQWTADEAQEVGSNPWIFFRPSRNPIFYSLPASGSTVSDSITEGSATSDVFTSQADLNAAFSDTNSVSEEVIAAASTLAQLQESSVVVDSVFASGGQNPTLSAATIFNVQATQATPRVTLTF